MRLYPLTFEPIFKERIWGGSNLKKLYGKTLPAGIPIGESWEISDRPGDVSVISNGPLAGKDLHWLAENYHNELLGNARLQNGRFPLLVKILDAQQTLSLQVHPPATVARRLGGEPKTEMWYIADAVPGAELYVGLKRGVTRQEFERRVGDGTVADCFHRLHVQSGDTMFLPSGRVHAVGAGLVIFEIQQNSDTTYRVFDWNRMGLDGKPRPLHVRESLESIDFNDFQPQLVSAAPQRRGDLTSKALVNDALFKVELLVCEKPGSLASQQIGVSIIGVVEGQVSVKAAENSVQLSKGQFCLLPASLAGSELFCERATKLLMVQAGA
jgi:mannose-6-phosphate isomerase